MDVAESAPPVVDRGLSVDLVVTPVINYAMQQNAVPLVRRLVLRNADEQVRRDLLIRLTTEPAFAEPWEARLAALGPGESRDLGVVDPRLSHDFLAELTERLAGTLRLTVIGDDETLAEAAAPVEVLAFDEWPGARAAPEILAAFVTPNQPVIETILGEVAAQLGDWTGDRALSGYQTRDRNRVLQTVAGLYAVLQRRGIDYISPPASFEQSGQKIRLPERVWDQRLGTCLDLAVLVAACLEQAGLNPLVVFTEGHAFAGAWLVEECFADALVDDVQRLRKRVDLSDIVAFETTLLTQRPAVPFEVAQREGRLKLDDAGEYRFALDLLRCRKSRIRPLPLRAGVAAAPQAADELAITTSAPLPLAPELPETDAPPPESPATRLDRWKRRLLDLSMRNRLLNFRETQKTLPLLCPDLAALEDALAQGRQFTVLGLPRELAEDGPRDAAVYRRRTGEELTDEVLRGELAANRLHAPVPEDSLGTRLLGIYRDARVSLDENGANTLYLALGFLRWRETPTGADRLAPLLLVPLQLDRRSLLEGFRLKAADDDPLVNTTLLELLLKDHDLRLDGLDPLPRDDNGLDVARIFQRFRQAVKHIDGWEVVEAAQIALFSFTKFLMWRDLEARAAELKQSAVVAHLIDTPTEPFPDDGGAPAPEHLDDDHPADRTFCVVSLDSSQLAAVVSAEQGRSFVLHGPPGTGKSQTITNLIAHAVGMGRSVLFVSEKAAALNVVHRRLVGLGLGPFCLELHSNKAQKQAVLNQLGDALDYSSPRSAEDWQREAERVGALRHELNGYARALHRRQRTGETVFQALARLMALRDAPRVALNWHVADLPTRDELDACRERARRLQHTALDCGDPRTSVWSVTDDHDWSLAWREQVTTALTAVDGTLDAALASGADLARRLTLPHEPSGAAWLATVASAAELLASAADLPAGLLTAEDWSAAQRAVAAWAAAGEAHNAHRDRLRARYADSALDPALGERVARWFAPQRQQALLTAHLAEPAETRRKLSTLRTTSAGLAQAAAGVAEFLGVTAGASRAELHPLAAVAAGLADPPQASGGLLTCDDWAAATDQVRQWLAVGRERDLLRADLLAHYEAAVLQLDGGAVRTALAEAENAFVLLRGGRRKAALAPLRALLKAGSQASADEQTAHVRQLTECQARQRQLVGVAGSAATLLGAAWRDGEADWDQLERALAWCDEVRRAVAQLAGGKPGEPARLRCVLADLLADREALAADAPVGRRLAALGAAATAFDQAAADAAELAGTPNLDFGAGDLTRQVARLADGWTRILDDCDRLHALRRDSAVPAVDEFLADLAAVAGVVAGAQQLADAGAAAGALLGHHWRGPDTDWPAVCAAVEHAGQVRAAALACGDAALCTTWAASFAGRDDADLTQQAATLRAALAQWPAQRAAVAAALGPRVGAGEELRVVSAQVKDLIAALPGLRDWCAWRAARAAAAEHGLTGLLSGFEAGEVQAEQLIDTFEHSYARWFIERVIDAEPALRDFRRTDFERTIADFRAADDRYMSLARTEIRARLAARVPQAGARTSENSEMGILLRQRQRQRGHMSVRSLFHQIPALLPRLKPCLLMSPLSVAQYLDPAHPRFDLVVFDEASQIPVWDAVGAISRGQSAIIVGDPKQLPPTSFFDRTDDDEDALEDGAVEDLESILDDCLAARLPEQHLRWHYRSRHESLIAFSNQQYYGNSLLTFPSPHALSAVSLRVVPGVYDRGGSRTNRVEAEAVVAEIVRRLSDTDLAAQSLGVVTFNQSQQRLIEDLLELARRAHPEIESAFSDETAEPVFVKNLENVQGDERDVILFSIGYGPDAAGRLSLNFGPLNRDGGARRLNVAVTRARRETVVYASLHADAIDLTKVRPGTGVADLRAFLDFAERGQAALVERLTVDPAAECESPFEEQVYAALTGAGFAVHKQVGCSAFRLDLAIVDPRAPGRYVLGIECDGATYHSGRTARDRDRLREEILAGLGWRLHRVWSTDWWEDPRRELARAREAIEAALVNAPPPEPPPPTAEPEAAEPSAAEDDPLGLGAVEQVDADDGPPLYVPCPLPRNAGSFGDFYDYASNHTIHLAFLAVVQREGPVSFELAARRVIRFWALAKLTERARTRLENLLRNAPVRRQPWGDRLFLWHVDADPEAYREFRRNGDADHYRDLVDIAPEELANAAAAVLEEQVALPRADLERETARMIGFQRVTKQMEPFLQLAVQLLLDRGRAVEAEGTVRAGDAA